MKKVLIISPGLSNGGAERVLSIIANYMVEKNYKIKFISVYNNEKSYTISDKIEYEFCVTTGKNKIKKFIERCIKLRKEEKDFNPDVIISFVNNETLFIRKKEKIIYSLRIDPKKSEKNIFNKLLRNYLYKKGKKIVFQTDEAMNYFNSKIKEKGIVILNPIDTKNMPKWEKNSHEDTIITACRLTKQKNLKMLIDSFSKVVTKFPNYKLLIYGDGPEKENIKNEIINKKLEKKIKLMGFSNNIYSEISKAKIFALSSDYEGLSNSMLEALVIGIPTVCTNCPPGGARMMIENGKNGFLVKVNDSEDMYCKIVQLIENEKLSREFCEANKKYRDSLEKNNICSKWEMLIKE